MPRQAVILVGGLGSRLGQLTADMPKPMLPVGGEPFLLHLLRNIARHGFEEILLLARHRSDLIAEALGGKQVAGAHVTVLSEPERAGTAGALREALAHLDETFLLSNGDSFFDFNYLALTETFRRTGASAALALREIAETARYGRVTLDDSGRVTAFEEKSETPLGRGTINGGVYVLSRKVVESLGPGELSLETQVLPGLVSDGMVVGQSFCGYFIDIGVPESLARAQREIPDVMRRKVVFLDRDGTLNRDRGYTYRAEDLEFLPGVPEAIRICNDTGRLVIVVTNQAGIARGYYSAMDMQRFHSEMNRRLREHGAHIDAFYHCPHHPDGSVPGLNSNCDCRKPGTGMLERAMEEWRFDLDDAILVGDKPSDIECAEAFGIRGIMAGSMPLNEIVEKVAI